MSAKTNIKTDLRDKDILSESLNRLNISHEKVENGTVVDYWNKTISDRTEIKISKYVGFERDNEGVLVCVGDTHYETGIFSDAEKAIKKVSQVYQGVQIALALENNPNFVIEESNLDQAAEAEEIVVSARMRS